MDYGNHTTMALRYYHNGYDESNDDIINVSDDTRMMDDVVYTLCGR